MSDIDTSAPHPVARPQVLGCRRRGRTWVVTVGGDLDTKALAPVQKKFDELLFAGAKAIVVDARAVTSADAGLLALLLPLHRQTALYLAAPSPPVRQVLKAAGGGSGVPCASSLGEALDAIGT
ncbi:STAS domain-containing protein [Streptomyces sp. NBC_01210]|uniref:STAS domain-containing protein n=1 Tax=Streptomyces sp. NBC_01210 TaxID=2903774 RepID=UPI002E12CE55|nr:STAS domain-containing protein [Streptomyces sp. NBC_01210]